MEILPTDISGYLRLSGYLRRAYETDMEILPTWSLTPPAPLPAL